MLRAGALTPQKAIAFGLQITRDKAEAYQLFLKQRDLSTTTAQRNAEGIALLQQAIGLDPRFALAHASLARRFLFRGYVTGCEDYLLGVETAARP